MLVANMKSSKAAGLEDSDRSHDGDITEDEPLPMVSGRETEDDVQPDIWDISSDESDDEQPASDEPGGQACYLMHGLARRVRLASHPRAEHESGYHDLPIAGEPDPAPLDECTEQRKHRARGSSLTNARSVQGYFVSEQADVHARE